MTYRKPEVAILGDAVRIIQSQQQIKTGSVLEESSGREVALSAAYDLDE